MTSVLKFALILFAAAILAMGARAMYISSLNRPAAPDPEVRIRVTAAALPAGLLLRDGDLTWQAVPRNKVPKDAMVEGTQQPAVHGALLRHAMTAGSTLHPSDMILPDAPGFLAAALKPGMRAVSVPINDVSGNAGLIQPGDYVDMILTQQMGRRGDTGLDKHKVVSETVLERTRVIAVGSSFQRETDNAKAGRARTVTIEVEPRTAEAVTVAAELGTLSLSLRSFATTDRAVAMGTGVQNPSASVVAWNKETEGSQDGPVWGSDVSRVRLVGPVEETKESKGTPRRIVIMRGNAKQEQELGLYAQ
ncbi:Flp pilus assembly protein CpaB [Castellaniella sp. MT123]|uniref:Flp pilus assembly protein CpaB n=1 Tax=Castellaniella sp. MT123 TaxID=3140381 RepID=UPI0031F39670